MTDDERTKAIVLAILLVGERLGSIIWNRGYGDSHAEATAVELGVDLDAIIDVAQADE